MMLKVQMKLKVAYFLSLFSNCPVIDFQLSALLRTLFWINKTENPSSPKARGECNFELKNSLKLSWLFEIYLAFKTILIYTNYNKIQNNLKEDRSKYLSKIYLNFLSHSKNFSKINLNFKKWKETEEEEEEERRDPKKRDAILALKKLICHHLYETF